MIEVLTNSNEIVAKEIFNTLQCSYRIEADLIKAKCFPPLSREIGDILETSSKFYGFRKGAYLAGVIEVVCNNGQVEICSLTVDPLYFRRGIASKLIQYILRLFQHEEITVETAVKNIPAINLYKKCGFIETKRWRTPDGISKLAMQFKYAF